jgi:NADH-quinone oxidoreductase subunit G
MAETVKIQIDGTTHSVRPGNNLLHTCLSLGYDLPYFCYHPAMGSVGACRQCAVKKFASADDKKGRIIMSCMEPVTDNMIISINDSEAKAFRASIIESLMTNHPHDCPVCDEGGECHLQDMTVMTGHNYRRFVFRKRTYFNQDLGPFIQHEMNRCIQCYRCVRFYRDYAGGRDFAVSGSANRVYFGRHKDGRLESDFSGNLVEVCPTGVFTDKKLRDHYTRKWDLTNSPSVCVNCSLGCNIIVSERYGSVRRIMNRYNSSVNGYFICDRGRFGYEYLNSPERITEVSIIGLRRKEGQSDPDVKSVPDVKNVPDVIISPDVKSVTDVKSVPDVRSVTDVRNVRDVRSVSDDHLKSLLKSLFKGKKITGIGSPAASLESNFALEMLTGKENFYHGVPADEFELVKSAVHILKNHPAHSPSLKEIEKSDAVLILGEDIAVSAPMMALAVRQAARNRSFRDAAKSGIPPWHDAGVRELAQDTRSPVFIATPKETVIDDLAEIKYRAGSAEIAVLGSAVAYYIDNSAPEPGSLNKSAGGTAKKIVSALSEASNPLIITGLQNSDAELLHAASNIALALSRKGKKPSLSIVFPECNSLGLGLMDGRSVNDLTGQAGKDDTDTLVIVENDLYKRIGKEKAGQVLGKFKNIIVLDCLMNDTAKQADIIMPSGTFAESTGTIINNEGRAQRYYRVLPPGGQIKDSWKHILEMAGDPGRMKPGPGGFDDIVARLAEVYPVFSGIREIMPASGYKIYNEKIARQTDRFSGRTAMNANIDVSENAPVQDGDSPLTFTMEGYKGMPPSELIPYYWSPGWNSVQAANKYMDEPDGKIKDDMQEVLLFNKKTGAEIEYFQKPGKSG